MFALNRLMNVSSKFIKIFVIKPDKSGCPSGLDTRGRSVWRVLAKKKMNLRLGTKPLFIAVLQ